MGRTTNAATLQNQGQFRDIGVHAYSPSAVENKESVDNLSGKPPLPLQKSHSVSTDPVVAVTGNSVTLTKPSGPAKRYTNINNLFQQLTLFPQPYDI